MYVMCQIWLDTISKYHKCQIICTTENEVIESSFQNWQYFQNRLMESRNHDFNMTEYQHNNITILGLYAADDDICLVTV